MPIAHRATTVTGVYTNPGANQIVATAPAGIEDGDILLAFVRLYLSPGPPSVTPPAGWTSIASYTLTTPRRFEVFWKRASGESGDYTFSTSAATLGAVVISAFSGCLASGSPIDVYSNTDYVTNNSTMRAGSVTTTVADAMLWAAGSANSSTAFTPPSGTTEIADSYTASNWTAGVSAAYVAQAAAGASGDKDFGVSATTTVKHAFLVALKPAVAGSSLALLNHYLLGG